MPPFKMTDDEFAEKYVMLKMNAIVGKPATNESIRKEMGMARSTFCRYFKRYAENVDEKMKIYSKEAENEAEDAENDF